MKSISPDFAEHPAGDMTKLVTCWKITRRDSVALGLPDPIRDVDVDAVNFRGFPHDPGNDQILRYPDAQS